MGQLAISIVCLHKPTPLIRPPLPSLLQCHFPLYTLFSSLSFAFNSIKLLCQIYHPARVPPPFLGDVGGGHGEQPVSIITHTEARRVIFIRLCVHGRRCRPLLCMTNPRNRLAVASIVSEPFKMSQKSGHVLQDCVFVD